MGLLEVRDRVQRMLIDIVGPVGLDRDGDFTVDHESVHVWVMVRDWEEGESTTVEIRSIFLWGVAGTPELFEYIATEANTYRFGALGLFKRDDGTYNVSMSHTLLGDTLDPEELKHALLAVTFTVNGLDDELKERFGGDRWEDL